LRFWQPNLGATVVPVFRNSATARSNTGFARSELSAAGVEELWCDDRIFRFEDLVSSTEGRRCHEPLSTGNESDPAQLYASGTMRKRRGVRLVGCPRPSAPKILHGVPMPMMFHLLMRDATF
jgi:hypothetical protein